MLNGLKVDLPAMPQNETLGQEVEIMPREETPPDSNQTHEGDLIDGFSNEVVGRARHISFLSLGSPNLPWAQIDSNFSWPKAPQQQLSFSTPSQLLNYVTRNWRSNFVTTGLRTREVIEGFIKRPFFMLVSVDAPLLERFQRSKRWD